MGKLDEYEAIRDKARRFMDLSPAVKDTFFPFYHECYKPGNVDAKTKRLMAMCAALVAGCTGCILGQLNMAVQEGATAEEVLETCAVAMSVGGTMAWANSSMVVEYLEENGMVKND